MTSLLLFIVGCTAFACTSLASDFTGIWKRNCSDYYGLQIKHYDNQLYSVSFCGLNGCFKSGEWTPNTPIEGDPKYKIISPEELVIGIHTYQKCTDDPIWIVAAPQDSEPTQPPPDCSLNNPSTEKGVMIAWVTDIRKFSEFRHAIKTQTITVGPVRPIAHIGENTIGEASGATIHKGQPFWPVLSPTSKPLRLRSVGSFFDYIVDECVYFGTFGKANPPRWTLLSSKPLSGIFRKPTPKDRTEFYRLNVTCIQQGDYPEGQRPPCVRPKLLAVTDINNNGKPEYWATQPYLWDTGVSVWEETNGVLVPLLEVCVGCSD